MKINLGIIWVLLFGISLFVDAGLIIGNATNCSQLCTFGFDTICATDDQIYFSNLLIICGFGCFVAAIRVLIVDNRREPTYGSLGLKS